MPLRVTQEYISVLGLQDGALRVTQQYISVLGTTPAEDELRVTQAYISVLSPESEDPDPPENIPADYEDLLTYFDVFDVDLIRLSDTLSDTLDLEDAFPLTFSEDLADTFDVDDVFYLVFSINETLELDDEFTVAREYSLEDTLELDDVFDVQQTLIRQLTDELDPDDVFVASIADPPPCDFGGFGLGEPPVLGTATLTLTYPFDTPTTTLVLRNPELGDQHSIAHQRIYRESRGGVPDVFKDDEWPTTETLNISVVALSEAQAQAFLTFMQDSIGDEIGLLEIGRAHV